MALEEWLLTYGEARPHQLDPLLTSILRRSTNAALTAVVASVATAFPRVTPETLLTLLSSPICVLLDRARMASESQAVALSGLMPFRDAARRTYDDERKAANARPHRRHDLETAFANLQLTQHGVRVQAAIDKHIEDMPPLEQQVERDRVWRLALHRMDLRQYTVASPYPSESPQGTDSGATSGAEPADAEPRMIRLDLAEADPDVQEMADRSAEEYAGMNSRVLLLMWGLKVFSGEEPSKYDPTEWRVHLHSAMELREAIATEDRLGPGRGGPEYIASVCLRDHFDELTAAERAWCIETVCDAVVSQADDWNETARVQRYSMGGDRPSAFVLSCLIGKQLGATERQRVLAVFPCAVLHPVDEVRVYAVSGAGQYLWSSDPQLAHRCINALATEATLVQERWETETARPYSDRVSHSQIEYEIGMVMRDNFYGNIDDRAFERLDITEWMGAEANSRILPIWSHAPDQDAAVAAFQRLATAIVGWWDLDEERDSNGDPHRSSDTEIGLTGMLEEFVLKVNSEQAEAILEPVLLAMDRHPDEVSQILQGITGWEDRMYVPARFWHIWDLFAARVRVGAWLPHIDNEHSSGGRVMSAVFLTQYWKDDVRHWRSLEGNAHRVDDLFEALAPSATVLDNYVRFLYHVGEQSLPGAFLKIASRLQAGDAQAMLRIGNTVFMLESLLRRHVYGRPMELKRSQEMREAVLFLLDTLVESGSSAAYQMRDDFVTPAS